MSGIELFSLFVLVVLLLTTIVVLVVLAMLPGRIAKSRDHPQTEAITIGGWLGLLCGGVFWPIILIWAFLKPNCLRSRTANDASYEALLRRVNELEASIISEKGERS
ncbi:DUF3302 domain-containing protein [Roseibium sp.]|uniref:DUF3302 domain-containing protein n=1 Tax=Roseibium sp. TaxID=1936156 RepID=UPI003BA9F3B9